MANVSLRDAYAPDVEADGVLEHVAFAGALSRDDLRAASADVEYGDGHRALELESRQRAVEDQPRFLVAADDPRCGSQGVARELEKLASIFRVARRAGA